MYQHYDGGINPPSYNLKLPGNIDNVSLIKYLRKKV